MGESVKREQLSEAFRLLRVGGDAEPLTLFHPYKSSRRLPVNIILEAEQRRVWNPGKQTGPGFLSGFHVFPDLAVLRQYIPRFKNTADLVICRVWVYMLRQKPRSKVTLAEYMLISKADWLCRVPVNDRAYS